jgi:hypothetical protein
LDYELNEDFLSNLSAEVVQGSIVNPERHISRGLLVWFQKETTEHTGLIGHDGKLCVEDIVKHQSVNKSVVTLKTFPLLADLTIKITVVDGWVLTQLFLLGFAPHEYQN